MSVLIPTPRAVTFAPDGATVVPRGKARIAIDPASVAHAQGYRLEIGADGQTAITAHDPAGAFYGQQTLKQLVRPYEGTGVLPIVRIDDWPDFPSRGVMFDISRDKVPTQDTLYRLVDLLAELKVNELQLYAEHTFAYKDHEIVWKDASPMTAAEIRALDAYCRERFIELVPNQNSFGHLERWTRHPRYASLDEMAWGSSGELCPVDPACITFLRGLYGELLPNFTSTRFNVGCDETSRLGKGRSKSEGDCNGIGRLYLNFLKRIHTLVKEHGKTMEFWGDIIMHYPSLIPELPRDVIALEWGYEANHPFAQHGSKFAAAGIPFHVVPGTSSWNSLLGRTDNALANLRRAAEGGLANGATGFLVTDWGDNGHWQFLPVSFAPFAYGAAVSWACEANRDIPLAKALDAHVFLDAAGRMGQAALDLGNAHLKTGVLLGNSSVFHALLQRDHLVPPSQSQFKAMTTESAESAMAALDDGFARMRQSAMGRDDAALILDEYETNVALARIGLRLGRERIINGDVGIAELPAAIRAAIAAELDQTMARYRKLWLARSRPGGLAESIGRMQALQDRLGGDAHGKERR